MHPHSGETAMIPPPEKKEKKYEFVTYYLGMVASGLLKLL